MPRSVILDAIDKLTDSVLSLKGGPGSGNFGHSGRPGHVGGSGGGSGSEFTVSSGVGPIQSFGRDLKVRYILNSDSAYPNRVNADKELASSVFSQMLGRPMTVDDAVSLAGVPSGSDVTVSVAGSLWRGSPQIYVKYTNRELGVKAHRQIVNRGYIVVSNDSLSVAETSRGVGTALLVNQVRACSRVGVVEIETIAGGQGPLNVAAANDYVGYYTWPRLGFDARLEHSHKMRLPDSLKGATMVSDLMKTPEGRKHWAEHGTITSAVFDTRDGSLSRKVLDAYAKEKFGATSIT